MMTLFSPQTKRSDTGLFGDAPPPDAPPTVRARRNGARTTGGDRTRILAGSFAIGAVFLFLGAFLATQQGLDGWRATAFVVATGMLAGGITYALQSMVRGGVGSMVGAIVAPSGSATPYEWSYSFQESLAARGEVEAALASYEEIIAADTRNFEARIRAADLYARGGNAPLRAARLFREVLEMKHLPDAKWLYAINRLVDLYIGPLNSVGRAMVELRRIADRFPGTREAEAAKIAIRNLKRDMAHEY